MIVYTVIMAGGRGTRLWPLSRLSLPKQFLPLVGGSQTLLQSATGRARLLTPPDRILVVTDSIYTSLVHEQIPDLPPANIIGEPRGRGTAACIGLAAVHIAMRHPDAIMIVLASDHVIAADEIFTDTFLAASEAVGGTPCLATIGIAPRRPETGFGYIHLGSELSQVNGHPIYEVAAFVEKPDYDRACSFLKDGNYLWNSGMFVWQVTTILSAFERYMPDLYRGLCRIGDVLGTPNEREGISDTYDTLKPITIDYGVMEVAENVVAFRGEFRWSDVGNWMALKDVVEADSDGNIVIGDMLNLDSTGCIIHTPSGKLVAMIGLKDTIIIDTDDVLLVCPIDRAQEVKKVVERLQDEGKEAYL
jgi:mannose-1-phosphate guanylyltransferase